MLLTESHAGVAQQSPLGRTSVGTRRSGSKRSHVLRSPRKLSAGNIQCTAVDNRPANEVVTVSPQVDAAIRKTFGNCIVETNVGQGKKKVGKVRDTYDLGDKLLLITTDRQSAFDRILAAVPFKGQVLNQCSAWWMDNTQHIVGNALLGLPDPNASVMKKCSVFPVEFVVRGFMTGSTDTSIWTQYSQGVRHYCGHDLPEGLKKNDRLSTNLLTPTTKAEDHDVPISAKEIVAQGLMSQKDWDQVSEAVLALFAFGQAEAAKRGLLLVDTKYEFGKDDNGNIMLIDEIHTPDSSRYWLLDSYVERQASGLEPHNIDKEFLRLWFRQHCDPYNDPVLPEAPADLVCELARRYVYLYEKITGEVFVPAVSDCTPSERINRNIAAARL